MPEIDLHKNSCTLKLNIYLRIFLNTSSWLIVADASFCCSKFSRVLRPLSCSTLIFKSSSTLKYMRGSTTRCLIPGHRSGNYILLQNNTGHYMVCHNGCSIYLWIVGMRYESKVWKHWSKIVWTMLNGSWIQYGLAKIGKRILKLLRRGGSQR